MAAKKPKIVQVTPSGAFLWDAPEPVQIVPPSLFGRTYPVYRDGPSPERLAALRRKYGGQLWHKRLLHDNAAGRYVASLENDETETSLDSPTA